VEQIEGWQKKIKKDRGTRFVFASDEWYINAGLQVPKEEIYEGYPQIENGVGMVRSLVDEVTDYLSKIETTKERIEVSLITGMLVSDIIVKLANQVMDKFENLTVHVYPIVNHFFGEDITVTGLLTGQDIIDQLKGKPLGEALLMSDVMLRSGEEILLDDMTVKDIEKALQTTIRIVKSDGMSLVNAMIKKSDR